METKNENLNRSKLYDDYEESLFRLIMNDVAQREGEELLKEHEQLKTLGERTSKEEYQKFSKLLDKEYKKFNRSKRQTSWSKTVNIAAAIILILCIAFSVSIVTVEAFRVKVLNFVIQMEEKYTTFEFNESDTDNLSENAIVDWSNGYVPTYLPEGFQVVKKTDTDASKSLTIVNKEGLFIKYAQHDESVSINLDTENASSVETIQINGNEAILVIKDSITSILWNQDQEIFLISSQLGKNETIKFAKSVQFIE